MDNENHENIWNNLNNLVLRGTVFARTALVLIVTFLL